MCLDQKRWKTKRKAAALMYSTEEVSHVSRLSLPQTTRVCFFSHVEGAFPDMRQLGKLQPSCKQRQHYGERLIPPQSTANLMKRSSYLLLWDRRVGVLGGQVCFAVHTVVSQPARPARRVRNPYLPPVSSSNVFASSSI